MRLRKRALPKQEHPMTEERDELKRHAGEQGLLHNDGTFAFPPDGAPAIIPWEHLPISKYTGLRYDPDLIGDYYL